jgi:hypothetical protein
MVELMSYGLTGLTAMLAMAFCFACGDEPPRTREKVSHGLISDAHLNDSRKLDGAIHSDGFQNDCGSGKAFNG